MRRFRPLQRWTCSLVCMLLLNLSPLLAAHSAAAEQVNLYMIALGDNGASGALVGCGDSLVPVRVDIAGSPRVDVKIQQALEKLFSLHAADYGASGLVNSLFNSTLAVQRIEIQNHTAAMYLTGTVRLLGECDDPRAEGQIEAVATQFPGINKAIVILNGGPVTSPAGALNFPITGHAVARPFYPYWEQQGGLRIFGYPLSDQLVEGGFRTQYFERQRFEHHPENAAPYNVLFGLVGLETAARRHLLPTPPFAPQATGGGSDCEYFALSNHKICGEFRTYWHSYGLDFGEAGVTARESLALFGFPISEPFTERLEDGNTYTVQYFERVRMELHPENAPPYRVLLGRLTADLVPR